MRRLCLRKNLAGQEPWFLSSPCCGDSVSPTLATKVSTGCPLSGRARSCDRPSPCSRSPNVSLAFNPSPWSLTQAKVASGTSSSLSAARRCPRGATSSGPPVATPRRPRLRRCSLRAAGTSSWDPETRRRTAGGQRCGPCPGSRTSRPLALVERRLPGDWEGRYALRPVETFCESPRGTCYRAACWTGVGRTQGRGKLDARNERALPPGQGC